MYRGFPGEPEGYVQPADEGWTTVGPSAVAYPGAPVPHALTIEEIGGGAGVCRAAGALIVPVRCREIHVVHDYLLHEFLSPASNLAHRQGRV